MEIKFLILIGFGLLLSVFLLVAAFRKPIWAIAALFLLRPISFYDTGLTIGPFSSFEFISIYMNFFIIIALFFQLVSRRNAFSIEGIDLIILIFTGLLFFLLLFYDHGTIKAFSLYFLPLLNFIIIYKMLDDPQDSTLLIKCLLWGYTLPILLTFYSILSGTSLAHVSYWTGQERYRGIFSNVHTMGHSMLLYLMVFFLHLDNLRFHKLKPNRFATLVLSIIALIAVYCLFKSVVRTTIVGLVIFLSCYFLMRNRKVLFVLFMAGILGVAINISYFSKAFYDVSQAVEGKSDTEMAGSGRLLMWKHNIDELNEVGATGWLLGTGLGSTLGGKNYRDKPWQSHNDYLDVLMNTGFFGLILYSALLAVCFFKTFALPIEYRIPFLALILTVLAVNFLSNSYISRFPLAQIFWMLMAIMFTIHSKTKREHKQQPSTLSVSPAL